MKLGVYIKLSVKYTCSNICSYFESDLKACKNFTFHSGKKDKSNGFHTLTHNLKTTTDTAMKLCMYIKLSVKYTCSSICTYFEC